MAVELTSAIVHRLEELNVFETGASEMKGISSSVAIVSYPEDGGTREELLASAEIMLNESKEERRLMRMPKRQLTPVQELRMNGRRHTA